MENKKPNENPKTIQELKGWLATEKKRIEDKTAFDDFFSEYKKQNPQNTVKVLPAHLASFNNLYKAMVDTNFFEESRKDYESFRDTGEEGLIKRLMLHVVNGIEKGKTTEEKYFYYTTLKKVGEFLIKEYGKQN